jgi:cytidine deaminase
MALHVHETARIAVARALHDRLEIHAHPLAGLSRQTVSMDDRELYEQAVAVAERAYAPYSNFHVGAAVLTRDGRLFLGVNVENAAYPLGVCAEKTALTRAVTDGCKPGDLEAIAINASPCGGCRQWLWEFGLDRVTYARANGEVVTTSPAQLLPDTFEL